MREKIPFSHSFITLTCFPTESNEHVLWLKKKKRERAGSRKEM